jgi:hypothetical protein
MKATCTQCHVYDPETNYLPFDFDQPQPSALLAAQRKWLPDTM